MRGRAKKTYRSGDQIHIAVTQNFGETATEFFGFCNENHYNPSEVIRSCMEQWLMRQKRIREVMKEDMELDGKAYLEREKRVLRRLREEGIS